MVAGGTPAEVQSKTPNPAMQLSDQVLFTHGMADFNLPAKQAGQSQGAFSAMATSSTMRIMKPNVKVGKSQRNTGTETED